MINFSTLSRACLTLVSLAVAGHAWATSTSAYVYVDLGTGDTVIQNSASGDAHGVGVSVDQPLRAGAQASASNSAVHASTFAKGNHTAQGQAEGSWNDKFAVQASGYGLMDSGTFSAAVAVQGGLTAVLNGRAYADNIIDAYFRIDGGVSGASFTEAHARLSKGYDIGTTASGQESATLRIDGIPFVFGQDINVSLFLRTRSAIIVLDGAFASATADYAHSMTWAGLSNVRDSTGQWVTGYSAISADSGFDYAAQAAAVPEPATSALLAAGLLWVGWCQRLRKRARA